MPRFEFVPQDAALFLLPLFFVAPELSSQPIHISSFEEAHSASSFLRREFARSFKLSNAIWRTVESLCRVRGR
jgi:hypothetical protein